MRVRGTRLTRCSAAKRRMAATSSVEALPSSAYCSVFSGARYVPATGANIDAAISHIALHETRGRSNHVEAVRRALGRPDVILILTDADDLSLTSFRSALADVGKPIAICVAKVSASGVGPPQQLR